jgi:phosphoglycerate dehydrogenase-like enzyme
MCKIPDENARARIEQYVDIVECESVKVEDVMTRIVGKEGLVVPLTPHTLVTREVIDRGDALKFIGSTYGGTRQNIEDEYAIRKGLVVVHTGEARARPMAEYTLSLVLSALHRIQAFHHAMRTGDFWPADRFGRIRTLSGSKVGVIGIGRIGSALLELLAHFTANIAIRSNHITEARAKEMGVEKLTLDEVFSECDVIILTGGYTPETHHMIDAEQFEKMKDGALFVNVARGGMVDEQAMIRAVSERNLFLALDVFEEEPLPADSPLRNSDRVLITPHRGCNAIECERRWQVIADEIERYYTGGLPESALTLERAMTMSPS